MTSGSPPPRRSRPASGGGPPRRRAPRSLSCRRCRSWASGSRSCRAWPRCMPTRSSSHCAASLPCATRALCSASSCRAPRTRRPSAGAQPTPRRWSRRHARSHTLHTRHAHAHQAEACAWCTGTRASTSQGCSSAAWCAHRSCSACGGARAREGPMLCLACDSCMRLFRACVFRSSFSLRGSATSFDLCIWG